MEFSITSSQSNDQLQRVLDIFSRRGVQLDQVSFSRKKDQGQIELIADISIPLSEKLRAQIAKIIGIQKVLVKS